MGTVKMGGKEIEARKTLQDLMKENADLRSEIEWRKQEAVMLRRSIGSGRIYSSLRESLCREEEANEILRNRVEELEAEKKSRELLHQLGTTDFRRDARQLVATDNVLNKSTMSNGCCDACEERQRKVDALYQHFTAICGDFEKTAKAGARKKAGTV